jgi:hypothetical protein
VLPKKKIVSNLGRGKGKSRRNKGVKVWRKESLMIRIANTH